MKCFAAAGDLPCRREQLEVSDGEDIGGKDTDEAGDTDEEFRSEAWLEDGVAGPGFEKFGFFVGGVAGLQDNDGSVGDAFESEESVEFVDVREGEVKENQIRQVLPGTGKGLPDSVSRNGVVTGVPKVVLEARGNGGIVFDDEDIGHGVGCEAGGTLDVSGLASR